MFKSLLALVLLCSPALASGHGAHAPNIPPTAIVDTDWMTTNVQQTDPALPQDSCSTFVVRVPVAPAWCKHIVVRAKYEYRYLAHFTPSAVGWAVGNGTVSFNAGHEPYSISGPWWNHQTCGNWIFPEDYLSQSVGGGGWSASFQQPELPVLLDQDRVFAEIGDDTVAPNGDFFPGLDPVGTFTGEVFDTAATHWTFDPWRVANETMPDGSLAHGLWTTPISNEAWHSNVSVIGEPWILAKVTYSLWYLRR